MPFSTPHSLFDTRSLRTLGFCLTLAIGSAASMTAFAHGHGGHAMGGSPKHIARMLDSVNATEAQRSQVKQIVDAAMADMKATREASKGLREQQMALFTQPTVDANAVEALRKQMLGEHDRSSQRLSQAMIEVSRVLTPEQRLALAKTLKARHEKTGHHDGRAEQAADGASR